MTNGDRDREERRRQHDRQLDAEHEARFRRDMMDLVKERNPQFSVAEILAEVLPLVEAERQRQRQIRQREDEEEQRKRARTTEQPMLTGQVRPETETEPEPEAEDYDHPLNALL